LRHRLPMGRGHDGDQAERVDRDGADVVPHHDRHQPLGDRRGEPGVQASAGHLIMAVVTANLQPRTQQLAAELTGISGRRRTKNTVMTVLMALCLIVVGGALLLVLGTVFAKGWSIVSSQFPAWFT